MNYLRHTRNTRTTDRSQPTDSSVGTAHAAPTHAAPKRATHQKSKKNYKTMKYILKITTFSLLLFTAACQKTNDKNPLLLGQWRGTEWLIFDKPSGLDAAQVRFEFKEDGTYAAQFGDQNQKGAWRTEKDKLYTTEEGKQEIMVKILKLNTEILEFEMNRGGQREILKLAK
jgi:hypothetical protein